MRIYVAVTGIIFGLLTLAHVWRMAAENRSLSREPHFLIMTLLAASFCVWAGILFFRRDRV